MFLHELLLFRSERSPRPVPRKPLRHSTSGDIKQHWWGKFPLPGPPCTHGLIFAHILHRIQRRLLLEPIRLCLEAADVRIRSLLLSWLLLSLARCFHDRQGVEFFDREGQLPQDLGVDEL